MTRLAGGVEPQIEADTTMGNIQVVSRGAQWVVIQRGNLEDLSLHTSLDEAVAAARRIAAQRNAPFIAPRLESTAA